MANGISRGKAEQIIIDRFIKGYKNLYGIDLVIVSHRDKPDFEVYNEQSEERFGVEVTGLYQDDREAKINYDREPHWNRYSGSWEDIVANLNALLIDKAEKSYRYHYVGKMVLAIYVGSLVYNESDDFREIYSLITMPENKYSEVWLVLRDSTGRNIELKALKI